MRFYIKNKFASISGKSFVTDDRGNNVFEVKGNALSLRRKKRIYDMSGNLRYAVKNKLLNLFGKSAFIIDANGEKIIKMKDKLLSTEYDIETSTGDIITVQGVLFQGIVHISKNGREIGNFTIDVTLGSLFAKQDSYVLEVYNREDVALLVAFVIAYDNIHDAYRD